MKGKLRKIINSILASSFTALAGSFDSNFQDIVSHSQSNIEINIEDKKKTQKSISTLVLKPKFGQMLLAGHKSHSSHSSHRSGTTGNIRNGHTSHTSHSSHRSATINDSNSRNNQTPQRVLNPPGARITSPYFRPNTRNSNTTVRNTINHNTTIPNTTIPNSRFPNTNPSNTNTHSSTIFNGILQEETLEYKLGIRQLSRGMKGKDVVELTTLLHKNGFINEISQEYTELVQTAVSNFQHEVNLEETGICDLMTINALEEWNNKHNQSIDNAIKDDNNLNLPKKVLTTNRRILKIGDYGKDVNELINILIKHKKLPSFYKNRILFDKNVEHALKKLQTELGLDPTGVYDDKTYNLLMEKEKN